jgi:ABC-type nitrate/sulfonate/bicarbonate transport system substrate-binding protein
VRELRIGFVPLVDAAVVIVAAERGFAAAEGLTLILRREPSWATLRDELLLGIVDAAHCLAPLAVATSLGLSPGGPVPMVAPATLSLNGNAITLSRALWDELDLPAGSSDPADAARALGRVLRAREATGRAPATFATVFPFSTHTFQLRAFLSLGGIDPDRDVRITAVPPPYATDALRSGVVDGFCVGAPWNSVAVEAGCGRIAALCSALTPDAPEKVIAWPRGRLAPEDAHGLVAALRAAARWCGDRANHRDLAALLATPHYLDVDPGTLRAILVGHLRLDRGGAILDDPTYLRLGTAGEAPTAASAEWILSRMEEARQVQRTPAHEAAARAVFAGIGVDDPRTA